MVLGKKGSRFEAFVQEMYMKHKDECRWYKVPCKYGGVGIYFKKNKWFLKRAFKEQS